MHSEDKENLVMIPMKNLVSALIAAGCKLPKIVFAIQVRYSIEGLGKDSSWNSCLFDHIGLLRVLKSRFLLTG